LKVNAIFQTGQIADMLDVCIKRINVFKVGLMDISGGLFNILTDYSLKIGIGKIHPPGPQLRLPPPVKTMPV